MPPLRQPLKKNQNRNVLIFAAAMVLLLTVDACLPPRYQAMSWFAVKAVEGYQVVGRPASRKFVVCRFEPSCSEFSRLAFTKHGFWPGLWMTASRLARCRGSVPLGTVDEP